MSQKVPYVLFLVIILFVINACVNQHPENRPKGEFDHLKGYFQDSVFDSVNKSYHHRRLVSFGKNRAYILDENMQEASIDSAVVDKYFDYNDVDEIQIPLNRFLKAPQYSIFIGISLEMKADKLAQAYNNQDTCLYDMFTDSTGVIRLLSNYDSLWNLKYLVDDNITYLFSFLSHDSASMIKKFKANENFQENIIVSQH
jgi:hypothetical protein